MMHSLSIALPAEAADRLRDLARRERRSPRQQATVLVLAALEHEAADTTGREEPARGTARRAAPTRERAR